MINSSLNPAYQYTPYQKGNCVKNIHTFDNNIKVYEHHFYEFQQKRYQKKNVHEPVEEDLFMRLVETFSTESFVFFDIGAAIGYYPILMKRLRPDAIIEAFEPLTMHRAYMQENFALNEIDTSSITIRDIALSNYNGTTKFIENQYGSSLVGMPPLKPGWRGHLHSTLSISSSIT